MIDVHVLTHEGTRSDWLDQCLASLEGEGVTVHVVDNAGRSVGEGRARGYALGTHPYVSYVDSDDYVLPGCFAACRAGLETHHAVVTMERVVKGDFVFPAPRPEHAVVVYRRSDVEPHLHRLAASPHTADWYLRRLLRPVQLAFEGYVWRVHADGDHHKTMGALKSEGAVWQTA